MKIRIKNNSIRLRLTRSEVARLAEEKYLEEQTEFGNTVFSYGIRADENCAAIMAEFANNKITMLVPAVTIARFVTTDIVGYQNEMPLPNGKSLFLLFEKDFKCIDGEVSEDQSDNYENPLLNCN